MKNNIFLKIIFLLFVLTTAARAEFEELGTSARAAGMGNCFIAIADDAYSIVYNPAGLGMIHHKEIATSTSRLFWGLSDMTTIEDNFIGAVYGTKSYGGIGIGVKNLNISGLYSENTTMVSYGKSVGKKLSLGATFKMMSKNYVPNAYTENSIDFTGATYGRDPVFANGYGKSVFSFDAGSYYRINDEFSAALTLNDLNSPDSGLASVVRIPMTLKGGLCYKGENLTVPFEIESRDSALTYSAGFERWFLSDQLAMRAGLQMGSGNLSDISCGLSYSYNNVIRFDYGFSMPFAGISNTNGSHRMSLVVFIGKPRPDYLDTSKLPKEFTDAITAFNKGEYITAYDMFENIFESKTMSPALKKKALDYIRQIMAKMQEFIKNITSPKQVNYANGLVSYSKQDYEKALSNWEEVLKIEPENTEIQFYVELLKKLLGLDKGKSGDQKAKDKSEAPSFKTDSEDYFPGLDDNESDSDMNNMSKEAYIELKLRSAVVDFNTARFDSAVKDCLHVVRADPNNELGYVRLGSAYYAMGVEKYAVKAWNKALKINPTNPDLIEFIEKIRKK